MPATCHPIHILMIRGPAVLATGMLAAAAMAAEPVVTGATLSGGSAVVITGSGMGTKATAAPYYFQDFTGLPDGADHTAAGLTWHEDTSAQYGTPNTSAVISSDGVGGKAMAMTVAAPTDPLGGFWPHLGIPSLPANTLGVSVSFWIKFIKTTAGNPTGSGQIYQWKGPRAGVYGQNPQYPTENYAASPKLSSQIYIQPDGIWDGNYDAYGNRTGGWTDAPVASGESGGLSDIWFNSAHPSTFNFYSTWIQRDTWLKLNDIGQSNGEVNEVINGMLVQNLTNLANRHFATETMKYVQIFPGMAFLRNKGFEIRVSRIVIDTTRARVFLGNAATLGACTARFTLPATAWSDTSVTATITGRPAGFDWVYVCDPAGNINAAGVAISAVANNPPVATAQSVTTAEDTAKPITLAATDADGNALTYAIAANPAHGTLSGSGASRTYTPAANYSGSDSFTFTANDGIATSAAATVSISVTAVNDAPVATAQGVTTAQDTATVITLAGSDVEGSALTYAIASGPAHGTLTGSGASRTYTPAAGYHGSDSFTFTVDDGALPSAAATVSISVTAAGGGNGAGGGGSSSGGGCGTGGTAGLVIALGLMLGLRSRRR